MAKTRLPTLNQRDFVDEYFATGNGTKAAEKVYNTTSKNSAGVIAHNNLKQPIVQEMLNEKMRDLKEAAREALGDGLTKAITQAKIELTNESTEVSNPARKFILDCAKFLDDTTVKPSEQAVKKLFPARH